MINSAFAKLLYNTADILELQNVAWKPNAYRKAARAIESTEKDLVEIYKNGGKKALEDIPGVGPSIAEHIIEYIKKGKVAKFEKILKTAPKGYTELLELEGLGPHKVKALTEKLGIKKIEDLQTSIKKHRLHEISGFGEKTEQNLLKSIELHKIGQKRMLLGKALPLAEEIIDHLKECAQIEKIQCAGSLRRMKETIGDIDILAISKDPAKVMKEFTKMPEVGRVIASGETKTTVIMKEGIHVDIRVLPKESYGAALQYFTGSKDHNIILRNIAIKKGYKLSEYGLFSKKTGKQVAGADEEGIYAKLGLKYVEPEMREAAGEIEAATKEKLPTLVQLSDIKGDFHVHTKLSDGTESVQEMAAYAQKLGYEYIAITDHSPSLKVANGLDIDRLKTQWKQIDTAAIKSKIKILKGSEVDILADGTLDYPEEILKKLNVVIGSVHTRFKMPKKEMTERICTALEQNNMDILAHPSGRLMGKREPYEVDMTKILEKARDERKVIEINSQPQRLDLNSENAKTAKQLGLRLAINTDSHASTQLNYMRYGVGQARRAGLTKDDIVNAQPLRKLSKYLPRIDI
jgi:DNA polymerase (family 10)